MPTIEFLRAALKNIMEQAPDNWMRRHGLIQIRGITEWAHELKAVEDPDYTEVLDSINKALSTL